MFLFSAAHCFTTNSKGSAVLNPPGRYKIGVGKYYLNFSDQRDVMAQYSDVNKLYFYTKQLSNNFFVIGEKNNDS